ncbi:MAG: hypothetical protein JXR96_16100 [Deltaproteobacteria bacterium]|nr:hypothetical protein [Deltaproteobacteria bacterium]
MTAEKDDSIGFLEVDDHQSEEIREIFGTAFPQYLQPVEEMLEQILTGHGDTESLEALNGMLSSLKSATERMGFDDAYKLLDDLHESISDLEPELGAPMPTEVREAILGHVIAIRDLAEQMSGGQVGDPGQQKTIYAALKDKKGVGDLVLRRLSAAGLVTVDQLLAARPDEVSAVTGLSQEIVHKLIRLLEADDAAASEEVESLHGQAAEKLRTEVELEARVEDLRAEARRLRARVHERNAELDSLHLGLAAMKRELDSLSSKMAERGAQLERIRARRDALSRKVLSSEEAMRRHECRLEALCRERRCLMQQADGLGRAISGLFGSLRKMRMLVVKGGMQDAR